MNSLAWLATSLVIAAAIVACAFQYSPIVITYQNVAALMRKVEAVRIRQLIAQRYKAAPFAASPRITNH